MLSVIIPSYNEEQYIEENLRKIIDELENIGIKYEVIVVEESSDKTPEIIACMQKKFRVLRHLHFSRRLGKGGAIEKGIIAAKGSYIIFTDADLSTDLSSLRPMVAALDRSDIVAGSRYHPLSKSNRTLLRLILSRLYSLCVRALLMSRVSDMQCGMKGFRKKIALKIIPFIRNKGFFWDTEFLFYAGKMGFRVREMPVIWVEKKVRGSGSGKLKNILYMGRSLVTLSLRNLMRSF